VRVRARDEIGWNRVFGALLSALIRGSTEGQYGYHGLSTRRYWTVTTPSAPARMPARVQARSSTVRDRLLLDPRSCKSGEAEQQRCHARSPTLHTILAESANRDRARRPSERQAARANAIGDRSQWRRSPRTLLLTRRASRRVPLHPCSWARRS